METNILLIDKPKDWTSFDVVAKVRGTYRQATCNKKAKVGHAGTLDPFATGLLIVLLGSATKKQDEFMKRDKEYEATLKLGFTSTTGDPEGDISPCYPEGADEFQFGQEDIEAALEKFTGEIEQMPHIYSAIKVDGKRAYELARKGEEVKLKPRKVTIYDIEVLGYEYPELKIRVKCTSGTYIRSLAEDIGKALGCGAYLTGLRRTEIGEYKVKDAKTIENALTSINLEKNL